MEDNAIEFIARVTNPERGECHWSVARNWRRALDRVMRRNRWEAGRYEVIKVQGHWEMEDGQITKGFVKKIEDMTVPDLSKARDAWFDAVTAATRDTMDEEDREGLIDAIT